MLVEALHRDPSIVVVSGGSPRATFLEKGIAEYDGVDLTRYLPLASNGGPKWTLRDSILFTRAAHVVVGPETGLINAAMAWGTPTVILHSHAAPENLVPQEHRHAVVSIVPDPERAPCAPCYRIVGDEDGCDTCDWGPSWLRSAYRCMAAIEPATVYERTREVLDGLRERWQAGDHHHEQPDADGARPGMPGVRAHRDAPGAASAVA